MLRLGRLGEEGLPLERVRRRWTPKIVRTGEKASGLPLFRVRRAAAEVEGGCAGSDGEGGNRATSLHRKLCAMYLEQTPRRSREL